MGVLFCFGTEKDLFYQTSCGSKHIFCFCRLFQLLSVSTYMINEIHCIKGILTWLIPAKIMIGICQDLRNYWRRLHELHLKRRNKINYYTNTSMTRKHKYISLRHLFSFYLLSIHQGYGRRVQYITESSMFHKIVFILWYVKSLKKCKKFGEKFKKKKKKKKKK